MKQSDMTASMCQAVCVGRARRRHLGPSFEKRLCKNVTVKQKPVGKKKLVTGRSGD